ncbi:SH3 domain-containing protein [Primorskyibacter sedentarius]|uniref:SH3 domain-containing protein n=1 Tax=Primorskyibacter sedentarius TaxID=745311 RepID=A0A4R3JEF4_9RHOB|nr:SH3 domain-containing protein [Primorskyibacter sedentarius]TCS64469.1 SH3 domain-containing protein [Primorskyibacter sedentarius]
MRITLSAALAAAALMAAVLANPANADMRNRHEVYGVDEGDMLKMRAGAGTGYIVIVGLPNGSVVRVHECEQTGSTRWCRVSLDRAPGLKGYVSWAYLREL